MKERWTQFKQLCQKFNIANLLFCYCLPIFYLFYPAWLMPAIFLRTFSFFIGWLYQLVMHHHTGQRRNRRLRRRRQPGRTNSMQQKPYISSSASSDSDDAAAGGVDQWMLKCSICLTQRYNLCLESCRDQFCKACFERYVDEVVQQSWGLGVTRIKCPVCLDPIRQAEWSRYVSPTLVDRYERFNQPFRPMVRGCPCCRSAVHPCQSPRSKGMTRQRRFETISELLQALGENPLDLQMPLRMHTIQTLSHQLLPFLKRASRSNDRNIYQRAAMVSKHLVALEGIPETWKQAQFWHVANFPVETCTHCGSDMCLQCGEFAHSGVTCIDNLRQRLKKCDDLTEVSTVQWQLENTRACPRCSILICRDEGCNKVDCLFCGFQFCWSCQSSWSQMCGFYECRKEGNFDSAQPKREISYKTELGVPDIQAIISHQPAAA